MTEIKKEFQKELAKLQSQWESERSQLNKTIEQLKAQLNGISVLKMHNNTRISTLDIIDESGKPHFSHPDTLEKSSDAPHSYKESIDSQFCSEQKENSIKIGK